jgi:nitrogen regulatory protein A
MIEWKADAISDFIDRLRLGCSSDYAALALPHKEDGWKFKWCYASGSVNQRYKQMVIRRGKGLPGFALLLGRTLTHDQGMAEYEGALMRMKMECPLMLAEGLQAAAAVPMGASADEIGVLMVGQRKARVYSESDLLYIRDCAVQLIPLLNRNHLPISYK